MKVTVEKDKGKYCLWLKTEYSFEPCGWRLRKDGKFTLDKFLFGCRLQAEEAMKLLQDYLNDPINMTEHRERKKEKYVEERKTIFG